jgi:hypothetical protein
MSEMRLSLMIIIPKHVPRPAVYSSNGWAVSLNMRPIPYWEIKKLDAPEDVP